MHPISRRAVIQMGAGALLSAGLAPTWGAPTGGGLAAPQVGVATLGFGTYSNRQLADELAAAGIRLIQLFLNQTDSRYWKYNGRSDVSDFTPQRCQAVAEAYRKAGITIHSIGVYTNLIHPDPDERKANLAYFEAMMRIGEAMGVRSFVTEAGHYHPEGPAPAVPYHFQQPVWNEAVSTVGRLAEIAERHSATVLLEPFYRGFLASAKRTRLFLQEVGSPRICALLDPANLLEVNDLEEMFDQLAPWIRCLHAKDRKLHTDRGVPAGQGDVDYLKLVTLAARRTPHAPLVIEYVGPDNWRQALAHVRRAIQQAGFEPRR